MSAPNAVGLGGDRIISGFDAARIERALTRIVENRATDGAWSAYAALAADREAAAEALRVLKGEGL